MTTPDSVYFAELAYQADQAADAWDADAESDHPTEPYAAQLAGLVRRIADAHAEQARNSD